MLLTTVFPACLRGGRKKAAVLSAAAAFTVRPDGLRGGVILISEPARLVRALYCCGVRPYFSRNALASCDAEENPTPMVMSVTERLVFSNRDAASVSRLSRRYCMGVVPYCFLNEWMM